MTQTTKTRARKDPFETKSGNYILRSIYRDWLMEIVALAHNGRVRLDGFGLSAVFKIDGSWGQPCSWAVKMLETRGLIKRDVFMDGTTVFAPTRTGYQALGGALRALGREIDINALPERIDWKKGK